jgi:predicted phage terminase large subunit-like protein
MARRDDQFDEELNLLKAQKAKLEARNGNLLRYLQLTMPDPGRLNEAEATRYQTTPQALLLCQIMEQVERLERKRVAVSIGPQLGKSQVISRAFPAFAAGRDPYRNLMLGTYNQDFANEFGEEVRAMIASDVHRSIFPNHRLVKGAVDLLITKEKGKTAFVGVGGSGTGKPADFFVVDDPIRSDDDAQSETYRNRIWKWFNSVVFTRCHDKSAVVVVHTRWHQDDLIGRLCDPDHPERNKEYKGIADEWTYINLPAVVEDPKLADALGLTLEVPEDPRVIEQFGTKPMSALWPQRKGLPFLAEAKRMDARTFNALYMGKPSADDGEYFKAEWMVEYEAHELPDDLRKFGASDHAVSEKQDRDYTVAGCIGVDRDGVAWVMPDLVWDRMETDRTVEELLTQFEIHAPELWWLEDELISKSFGPFLKQQMIQKRLYVTLDPVRPSKDKKTRARAIQGRMALKQIRFPKFAPWWQDARSQMLKFPYGANDDFVDWLAHIGQGVLREFGPANNPRTGDGKIIQVGSPLWILKQSERQAKFNKLRAANEGF